MNMTLVRAFRYIDIEFNFIKITKGHLPRDRGGHKGWTGGHPKDL